MQPTTYITPRIHGTAFALAAAWILTNISLHFALRDSVSPNGPSPTNWASWVFGVALGTTSVLSWVGTTLPKPAGRTGFRCVLVVIYVLFVLPWNDSGWLKHAVNMTGLLLTLGLVFFAFKIPRWSTRNAKRFTRTSRASQFGVGEIIALTTAVAILLAFATRFSAPIDGHAYWLVLIVCWVMTSLIAAFLVRACLATSVMGAISNAISAALLLVITTGGLRIAEIRFAKASEFEFQQYAALLGGFGMTWAIATIGGRFGEQSTQQKTDKKATRTEQPDRDTNPGV